MAEGTVAEMRCGARFSTERKVQAGFAIALVCLAGIGIMSFLSVNRLRLDGEMARHTEVVISSLRLLLSTATDAETAQRGYVITGDENFLKPYEEARNGIPAQLDALRTLTADDPGQQHALDILAPLIAERMAVTEINVELRRSQDFAAARAAVASNRGRILHDRIRELIGRMERKERELLREREADTDQSGMLAKMIILLGSALALMTVGLALWFIRRDLAGSRGAEAALREANERLEARVLARTVEFQQQRAELQLILDTVPALIFFKDREHRLSKVNSELAQLIGRPKEEIEGRTDAELGSPYAARYARDEDEILATGRPKRHLVEPMKTPIGTRWLQTDKIPQMDEAGRIVGIVGFALDITERRDAENAAALLAAIVQSSFDAIIGKDLNSIVTSWNSGAERMFGYTAEEMIGRSITQIIPPDRREEEDLILPRIRRGEAVEHFETVRKRKDGALIDVSVTLSPIINSSGEIIGASKVARDITETKKAADELRKSEERFSKAFHASPVIIAITTYPDGKYVDVNEHFITALGYSREEVLGRRALDLGVWAKPAQRAEIIRMLEAGESVRQVECEYLTKTGSLRTSLVGVEKIVLGDQPCLLFINHDITERKRAEERATWLASFPEKNPIPILEIGMADGKFHYLNPSAVALFPDLQRLGLAHPLLAGLPDVVAQLGQKATVVREVAEAGLFYSQVISHTPDRQRVRIYSIDVTEQKRAEQVIVQERDFSEAVLHSLPGVLYLYDETGKFLRWNKNFERVTGYSGAEIATMHPLDFFGGAEKELLASRIGEVFAKGESNVEAGFISKDGRSTPYYFTGVVTQVAGKTCLVGVGIDITERRKAEEARQESDERMRLATEATAVGIFEWNILTDLVHWDAQMFRLYGVAPTDDGVVSYSTWSTAVLAEDLPEQEKVIRETIRTRGRSSREFRIRRPGEPECRYIEAVETIRCNADGVVEWVVGTNLDVTARKRAENDLREKEELLHETDRRLAEIVHGMTEACFALDSDWYFTFVNNRGEMLLHQKRDDMLGRKIWEVFPQINGTPYEAHFRQTMEDRIPSAFEVFSQLAGRWLDVRLFPTAEGIAAFLLDIQPHKQAEERITQLNSELEQRVTERTAQLEAANRELESFSYSVSHDLRAPLRTVDGFAQAVVEDYGAQIPPEGRRYLETIRQGAQRMGNLIDDLLTFARLSRTPLSRHRIQPALMVLEVWEDLAPQRQGRRVELRTGELAECSGDSALLRQVWMNLLSNALKYSRLRDPAVIEVGSRAEGDETVYFIRDNGTGFDMRYAHKLFGVFQRLHRAEEYEGTGVGLAIVQRVIHRHGGRVWAEAVPDQGASFYFTLPPPN